MNVIFLIYIYTLCKFRGKWYIYFCFQAIKEGVCKKNGHISCDRFLY